MDRWDTRTRYVPSSDDALSAEFFIACQVKESCERTLARCVPPIISHLRKCKGRRDLVAGWELWLVKRNTIRRRVVPAKEYKRRFPQEPDGGRRELRSLVEDYVVAQRRLDGALMVIENLGEQIRDKLVKANRTRMVIAGIEFWLVKKHTVRCRLVGHNEYAKYFKPFPEDD